MRKTTAFTVLGAVTLMALSGALSCRGRLVIPVDHSLAGSWSMMGGDAGHRAYSAEQLTLPLTMYWRYRAKGPIVSSPVLVGGLVCFGSLDKRFYLLSAGDGERYDVYKTDSSIASSPAIGDGAIYFATEKDDETVYALNLKNGKLRWKVRLGDISAAVTFYQGRILVGTSEGRFHCLSAADGEELWRFSTNGQMSTSAAVVAGKAVFGCDGGYLYALEIDGGEEVWRQKLGGAIWSSPIAGQGMIYASTYDGMLYCLEENKGQTVWTHQMQGNIIHSAALGTETVYQGSEDGLLQAMSVIDGRLRWFHNLVDARPGPPLVVGDTVLLGASDGQILALGANDGQLLWSHPTARAIVSTPAVWQDQLFVGSMDGYLYVFGPEPFDSTTADLNP